MKRFHMIRNDTRLPTEDDDDDDDDEDDNGGQSDNTASQLLSD